MKYDLTFGVLFKWYIMIKLDYGKVCWKFWCYMTFIESLRLDVYSSIFSAVFASFHLRHILCMPGWFIWEMLMSRSFPRMTKANRSFASFLVDLSDKFDIWATESPAFSIVAGAQFIYKNGHPWLLVMAGVYWTRTTSMIWLRQDFSLYAYTIALL